jgi:hypothetical protein
MSPFSEGAAVKGLSEIVKSTLESAKFWIEKGTLMLLGGTV